jgi:hypothetical protein
MQHAWERWQKRTKFWSENLKWRTRRRGEDNIRTDRWEIGWEGVDWMHATQDRDQWRALSTRLHKRREISWLAAWLLAPEEGLWCLELDKDRMLLVCHILRSLITRGQTAARETQRLFDSWRGFTSDTQPLAHHSNAVLSKPVVRTAGLPPRLNTALWKRVAVLKVEVHAFRTSETVAAGFMLRPSCIGTQTTDGRMGLRHIESQFPGKVNVSFK